MLRHKELVLFIYHGEFVVTSGVISASAKQIKINFQLEWFERLLMLSSVKIALWTVGNGYPCDPCMRLEVAHFTSKHFEQHHQIQFQITTETFINLISIYSCGFYWFTATHSIFGVKFANWIMQPSGQKLIGNHLLRLFLLQNDTQINIYYPSRDILCFILPNNQVMAPKSTTC